MLLTSGTHNLALFGVTIEVIWFDELFDMFRLGFGSTLWKHTTVSLTFPRSSSLKRSAFLPLSHSQGKTIGQLFLLHWQSYSIPIWPQQSFIKGKCETKLVRNSLPHARIVFQLPLSLCFSLVSFRFTKVCALRYHFNPDACSHSCCFHSSVCASMSDDRHSSGRV